MTTLFRRATRRKNTADAVGRVVVNVILQDPKRKAHTTGNITRSFALEGTTVGRVAAVLEATLGKGV
jgi:hypothetical protein